MSIGTSIVLIAIGAIIRYAITADFEFINREVLGLILMIAGIIGLILSLLYSFFWSASARRRDVADYDDQYRRPPPRY